MKAVKQFKFTSAELVQILLSHVQMSGHPEVKPSLLEVTMSMDGDTISTRGIEGEKCLIVLEVPLR